MALVFPNLTFEDELTGRTDAPTPETLRALSELAPLMALVGDAGDILAVSESGLPSGCPAVLSHVNFRSFDDAVSAGPFDRILPWGWTSVVRPLAEKCGVAAADIPNAEAVEIVNSRRFSAEFDPVYCEDPSDLPFGAEHFGQLCRSEEQWHDVVSRLTDAGYDRWVAKPQISHAGRNRLLANRHELNDQQYGWLRKHLAHPAGVYVEPWVQPMLEAGLQFDICRVPDEVADTTTTSTCDDADSGSFSSVESVRRQMSAEFHDELLSPETQVPCEIPYRSAHANVVIRFSGATGLINDHVGRFLGSTVCADGSIEHFWRDAVRHGFRVCRAAADAGYFGPIGIDSFRFLTKSGQQAVRPCNDINGRFTMGRLALQLRKSLQPDQYGLWLQHVPAKSGEISRQMQALFNPEALQDVDISVISPELIGGRPPRTKVVFVSGRRPFHSRRTHKHG